MTDPFKALGHGPGDPAGYLVTRRADGYAWTRIEDQHTEGPFPTRAEAVTSAEADRQRHIASD